MLYESVGDEVGAARTEWGRANLMVEAGQLDEAYDAVMAARDRYVELNDAYYVALAAGDLAWIHSLRGERPEAAGWALESLRAYHAMRDRGTTILTLAAIALVGAGEIISPTDAATLFGAFEQLCAVHGVRPPAGLDRMIYSADPIAQLRQTLPSDAYAAAIERGKRMTLDEAVALAIESVEAGLGAAPTAPPDGN
jgi:hypothetical protein